MNEMHDSVKVSYNFMRWLHKKIDLFLEKYPNACEDCSEYLTEINEEISEIIEALEKGE